jgi:ketosteroid isomerase-like protein
LSGSLDDFIEQYHQACVPFSRGESAPMKALFSRGDDVVLANPFGPAVSGWTAASDRLDFASSRLHDGDVTPFDEVVRYASGDLVVLHETEYWKSRVSDRGVVEPWVLRVTTTFRRENGDWRVVHRHADPIASIDQRTVARDARADGRTCLPATPLCAKVARSVVRTAASPATCFPAAHPTRRPHLVLPTIGNAPQRADAVR